MESERPKETTAIINNDNDDDKSKLTGDAERFRTEKSFICWSVEALTV